MARRAVYIFAGIALLAAPIATLLLRNNEPRYKGRTLSHWIDRLPPTGMYSDNFPTPQDNLDAKNAIRHVGTKAIPYLVKWVDYEQPVAPFRFALKHRLLRLYVRTPFAKREIRATAACLAIRVLGADAAPAVPDLIRISTDQRRPRAANHANHALWSMIEGARESNKPEASKFLSDTLSHSSSTVRAMAAGLMPPAPSSTSAPAQ